MSETRLLPAGRFGFRYSDLFRISSFGFRISAHPIARQRLLLLLATSVLFVYGLGDRDLISSHEARAAQNAQMVLTDGHWLLPRLFDGQLELQKPPLYYWLVALCGWAGSGVGAWAVRLPAALSAVGCVLFVHHVGCRVGRPRAGLFAALILATCLHFTWMARVGRIDMPLTLMLTVALGSFHLGRSAGASRGWFLLGYTALGFGVLLKGPIALVLPALVGMGQWVASRRARPGGVVASLHGGDQPRRSLIESLWWGVPLILLIAGPWFVWANLETHGRLWDVFFWYHNVERGLGGSETLKAHPWWFYGPSCLIDLLPWSLALPLAGWAWLRRPDLRADPEARLGACWFLAVLAFLSCMSFKRADYLLPAYPGFALLLGFIAERLGIRQRVFGVVAVGAIVGWGWYDTWIVPRQEGDWPHQRIAEEIRARTDRPVVFFRAESHVLAFHVQPPLTTILEWENLAWWVDRPFPVYIVMPEEEARDWPQHLLPGRLVEVLRTRDRVPHRREHRVVVLRSMPPNVHITAPSAHSHPGSANPSRTAADPPSLGD
jgi:4-amino-4-deoxy-L-arabinose transferase-like glycosyltransferase